MAASWAIAAMVLIMFIVTLPVAMAYTPTHWHRIERADGRNVFTPYKRVDAKLRNIWLTAQIYQMGIVIIVLAFLIEAYTTPTAQSRTAVESLVIPALVLSVVLQTIATIVRYRSRRAIQQSLEPADYS